MFGTFPGLLQDMTVFNYWAVKSDETSKRLQGVARKLFGAMLLSEHADEYPRSSVEDKRAQAEEMRALDAYVDAGTAQLHGALDMVAAALSAEHGLVNRWKQPYSFSQMFSADTLDGAISNAVGAEVTQSLQDLLAHARGLIDENNTAKHRGMPDVLLFQEDYPDYLRELSEGVLPSVVTFAKDMREAVAEVRRRVDDIGHRICELISLAFPVPIQRLSPASVKADQSSRGAPHHPPCPACGARTNVMRATYLDSRGSFAGAGAALRRPRYWLCDDRSHDPCAWSTTLA